MSIELSKVLECSDMCKVPPVCLGYSCRVVVLVSLISIGYLLVNIALLFYSGVCVFFLGGHPTTFLNFCLLFVMFPVTMTHSERRMCLRTTDW